jgi:hypothetical protein
VVVDVSNSPIFDDTAIEFFRTATTNLLTAEKDAGIGLTQGFETTHTGVPTTRRQGCEAPLRRAILIQCDLDRDQCRHFQSPARQGRTPREHNSRKESQ